jgi:hypothetical protein
VNDPAVWTLIALLGASSASMVAVLTFALPSGFRRVEDRLGRVEDRLGRVEDRLGRVEDRMTGVEWRLDGIDRRLGHLGDGAER